ncbi:ABC transporter E member 2 [Salvia divinorum]|uniref:ABC transporter E member 2 n=1 Tax=Salvia divinorum TaxID=28513 RepID=A0ABD1G2H6_SALDI
MTITRGNFRLKVVEGEFTDSQIIVMLRENGTGKTTFLHMLAGLLKPDSVEGSDMEIPKFNFSYKQERIGIKLEFECIVEMLLCEKIPDAIRNPHFLSNVFEPLLIRKLMDKELGDLSAGELQKVALTLCLGKPADIYPINEPSTYLDSEQCIVASTNTSRPRIK